MAIATRREGGLSSPPTPYTGRVSSLHRHESGRCRDLLRAITGVHPMASGFPQQPKSPPPDIARAALHLYQLYDVGDAIDLESARVTLTAPSARVRPVVSRGGSIDIPQLPLEVGMGDFDLTLAGAQMRGHLHARIYDLGIVAFRFVLSWSEARTWEQVTALLAEVQTYPSAVMALFDASLDLLRKTLAPAIERPNDEDAIRAEDY